MNYVKLGIIIIIISIISYTVLSLFFMMFSLLSPTTADIFVNVHNAVIIVGIVLIIKGIIVKIQRKNQEQKQETINSVRTQDEEIKKLKEKVEALEKDKERKD